MPRRVKTKKLKKNLDFRVWSLEFLLFGALGLFLILNIFFSQVVSPLYVGLTNEERPAAIYFLRNYLNQPGFPIVFAIFKNIYGRGIEDEIYVQERAQKQLIKNLEQILQKNPKSRDVLYSLFLLYKQVGNEERSSYYLRLAKEVDPTL